MTDFVWFLGFALLILAGATADWMANRSRHAPPTDTISTEDCVDWCAAASEAACGTAGTAVPL